MAWNERDKAVDLPFLAELCRELPKVDLHQHLTGSLPPEHVRRMLLQVNPSAVRDVVATPDFDNTPGSLQAAWSLLDRQCTAVGHATADPRRMEVLFASAIEAWAAENVMYCEIRIGLKDRPTKREYLELLTWVIVQQKRRFPATTVRLLLSVNRAGTVALAEEIVDLAIEAAVGGGSGSQVVCGIELGGVATCGDWTDFLPLFRKAREAGLKVALHCGEDKRKQKEWAQMLEFAPDRLGHCVHLDDANTKQLIASGIPVETALTCHRRHFGVPIENNIFGTLFPKKQVVLCTDNPSFYETTLSDEYRLCCECHQLRVSQLFQLARRAISFTFQGRDTQASMLVEFDRQELALRKKYNIAFAARM